MLGCQCHLKPQYRNELTSEMFQFCTVFWVGFPHIPRRIELTHVGRVPITKAFAPTQPRSWLIDFWNLDVGWVFFGNAFRVSLGLLPPRLYHLCRWNSGTTNVLTALYPKHQCTQTRLPYTARNFTLSLPLKGRVPRSSDQW